MMKKLLAALAIAATLFGHPATGYASSSRIKDLVDIEGIRDNQLIGYGVVVGLNGTGDTMTGSPAARLSYQAMLERLGINVKGQAMKPTTVASVIVTATLRPFATQGTRFDVKVSAIGDAKSLQGGELVSTQLIGLDGQIYAIAQGAVAISGFQAEGAAAKIVRGVPTVGRVANGAILEREADFVLNRMQSVRLALRNPDLTTSRRVAATINDFMGAPTAEPLDPATVNVKLPSNFTGNLVALLTEIEQLRVEPDRGAKVVIDEASGIIVMGRDVRVSTVAIAQGNMTVTISEQPLVSQPAPLSEGQTAVVPRTQVEAREDGKKLAMVKEGISLQELVDGLNGLGLGPRDLISIIQAIKAAGALQADIEIL